MKVVKREGDIISKVLRGSEGKFLIVLDLDRGMIYAFNEVVAEVWEALPASIKELYEKFGEEITNETLEILEKRALVEYI